MPCSWTHCLFLVWGLVASVGCPAAEPAKPLLSDFQEIKAFRADVAKQLQMREFAKLDKQAEDYRSKKERFPDGSWKLTAFYQGLTRPGEYQGLTRLTEGDGTSCLALPDIMKAIALLEMWKVADLSSITPRIALAHAYVDYAWLGRGPGEAAGVSEDAWKRFRDRLDRADRSLREVAKSNPQDPSFYHAKLRILAGERKSRPQIEMTFQKAIQVEPLYYPTYAIKAIYLLPDWQGNAGEWQRFATETVASTREKAGPSGEKEGDTLYTRIAWAMALHHGLKSNLFTEYKISWAQMKKGFRDMATAYPHSALNLNWFCRFACMAEDRATARALMERIGDHWDRDAWETRQSFERWREWALDHQGVKR